MKRSFLMRNSITAACVVAVIFVVSPRPLQGEFPGNFSLYEERMAEDVGDMSTSTRQNNAVFSVTVPILIYHGIRDTTSTEAAEVRHYNVSPAVFEKQMLFLQWNGYQTISLHDLMLALDGRFLLPEKPVIITFDDGWRDQFSNAFPVLERLHMTATFFVFTNAIGRTHFLDWPQLMVMDAAGMTIGSHTVSHPYLVQVAPLQAKREIEDSKKILEEGLHKAVTVFAYPFGHYNDSLVALVKAAGYEAARSTYPGITHIFADRYVLQGKEVTNNFADFERNFR